MKQPALLILLLLLFSPFSHAWVIDADFEDGKNGSIANGARGISESFKQTVYSNEIVRSGSFSAKATINAGSNGFGNFGGNWILSSKQRLQEGDEIWYRVWLYVPRTFSFSCGGCSEGAKFMRIHAVTDKGASNGYWNLHLLPNGITLATSVTQSFYDNHPWPYKDIRGLNGGVEEGAWHAYEQYIKFSSTPGKGIYRAWYDGRLVFEDKITKTLKVSTNKVDKIQLFTFWRSKAGEKPKQTQSLYVDDIIITNEQPDTKDSNGYPYIGVGNTTFTAPPKPPKVQ